MLRNRPAIRKPVRRTGAEQYILSMLLAFALTVIALRLFLELTGYPQLGNSTLHISHLLWGGLALFVAAILPLIFANRWAYDLGAVLAGIGVGLFIDEVGKFITQSNDYFYPPSAPIIYAIFLLCVLMYLRLIRPRTTEPRSELYAALLLLQEVLDRDLEQEEKEAIEKRLSHVLENTHESDLKQLSTELLKFIEQSHQFVVPSTPDMNQKIKLQMRRFETQFLPLNRFRLFVIFGLLGMGLFSMTTSLGSLLISLSINPYISSIIRVPDLVDATTESWFLALHVLQFINSLLLLYSAMTITKGDTRTGTRLGLFGLLVYLTIVDLFLFYYYQFSTIISVLIQFALLLALIRLRQRTIEVDSLLT